MTDRGRAGRSGGPITGGRVRKPKFGPILPLLAVAALIVYAVSQLFGDSAPSVTLRLVSGSENKALQPIVEEWAREEGVDVAMSYLGSVDISRELERGAETPYDAVWPASSLWIDLGDSKKIVKHAQSILRSPVVLGLKRPIAERLGWIGRDDVTIQDIQAAAVAGEFRLAMTSATQSNSGASAFFGFLHALAGDPDALTAEMLDDPSLRDEMRALLGAVDRSSGSSGWLKEAFVANPDRFDAMVNYEALVIEANQAFERAGQPPLHVIYPANGLSVADSPLAYVDKGDEAKEQAFLALQAHLLSPEVQDQLIALGRRAGLIGLDVSRADKAVWNPAWGVDLGRGIAPIPTPKAEVIRRALTLYQTELRKPSLTVWVLDVSGSMDGEPIGQLKEAMRLLLDPEQAATALLQPSARDVTVVIPFNSRATAVWSAEGADPAALAGLLRKVERLSAGGGTDLYAALMRALETLDQHDAERGLEGFLPAIVAMTDGDSDTDNRNRFKRRLASASFGRDVPIHAIAFGQANEEQLSELTGLTVGRLFEAKGDLVKALRSAKGYN